MKSFKYSFFAFFLIFSLDLTGQKDPFIFEKEYPIRTLEHKAVFEKADIQIDFLDTIIENEVFLATLSYEPRNRQMCLLKRDHQHWIAFQLGRNYSEAHYKLREFDSIPGNEIHISLHKSGGRSTWSGGFSEYTTKELVLSLRDFKCYFSLEYMACYINWSNTLENDNDPNTRDEIIGSELEALEGTKIDLKISQGKLFLKELKSDCGSDLKGYEGPETISNQIYEYKFQQGKLVLESKSN